jgi:hypothetical protein
MHVGLHDDGQQGPVDAAARLQQRREERALPQLGDAQLHITGLGRQQPRAGAVAMGGAGVGALIPASADVLGGSASINAWSTRARLSRMTSRSPPARSASSRSAMADLSRAIVANSLV